MENEAKLTAGAMVTFAIAVSALVMDVSGAGAPRLEKGAERPAGLGGQVRRRERPRPFLGFQKRRPGAVDYIDCFHVKTFHRKDAETQRIRKGNSSSESLGVTLASSRLCVESLPQAAMRHSAGLLAVATL